MSLMTRYVLVELLKVFLAALSALTVMIILGGVIREAVHQSLPPAQVAGLIPYILPDALRIAIPVTLLLAATSVFGRMSGSNEVVALKASGISPLSILRPVLVLSFFVSLLTVWLNDLAVSWGRNGAQRVIVESVEEIAYSMLRTQKRYTSPTFAINVAQVRDRTLIRPTISIQGHGDTPGITIRAQEAELACDREQGMLHIRLINGRADVEGGVSMRFPRHDQVIPLSQASRAGAQVPTPSWLPLRQITVEARKQREEIAEMEQEMAALAALQMIRGDFEGLTGGGWKTLEGSLRVARAQLNRLLTEPHRRWSAGFSCLCFVWVGAPLAVRLRNRDFLTSFFLCFLPILTLYYPLMIYGVDGAKGGTIPPWSVWAGNAILAICGGVLLRHVTRY